MDIKQDNGIDVEEARVWWIPQIPGKPFHVKVDSLEEAKKIMDTLANYDLFQLKHHIKPDYSNAGGLEVKINGEWEEWNDDCGEDIDHTELLEASN